MAHLRIIVEGHAEERFVREILAPHLGSQGVFATATLIDHRPKAASRTFKGGGNSYAHWRGDIGRTLKQQTGLYVTTMVDLYALPFDFPDASSAPDIAKLETSLRADIAAAFPGHERFFLPYVQRHEFEALLFVMPEVTADAICPGDQAYVRQLREIRDAYGCPEDIDDGPETAPSKRLGHAYAFQKVRFSSVALENVPLSALREACPHFGGWLSALEELGEAL